MDYAKKQASHDKNINAHLRRYIGFTSVVCIGTILSIIAFITVLRSNTDRLEKEFLYESGLQVAALRHSLSDSLIGVELLQKFFLSSENVTSEEFNNFVEPLFRQPNFNTILWVDASKIDKFRVVKASLSRSADGYNNLESKHPDFSLADYPEIISSIDSAGSTKTVTISKVFNFLNNSKFGNIAFVYPVVHNNNLKGFLVSILELGKVFPKVFYWKDNTDKQNVYLYEVEASGGERLIYYSEKGIPVVEGSDKKESPQSISVKSKAAFEFTYIFELNSLKWRIVSTPSTSYIAMAINWIPWAVLCLGIIMTFIIGLFLFYLIGRNIEISKEVAERSGDLDKMLTELSNSKNRLQAVLNTVLDGIVTINDKGIVQSFNPAAEKIFGYKALEVVNKNVSMLMPDPYTRNHDSYINNYLETGVAKIIGIGREVQAMRKDGSAFPMELALSEMSVSGDKMFVGIIRDITDRKNAEQEVTRMANIIESSADAIISKTLDGIITSWNTGAQMLFGYSADEIIGKHINILVPEDKQKEESNILTEISDGKRIIFETTRKAKNGRVFYVSVSVSPIHDAMGNIVGAAKIARDISESKKAEQEQKDMAERLAAIMNTVIDGIITINHMGIIQTFNPSAERIFGYEAKEVVGRNVKMLMPEPYHAEHDGYLNNYITTGKAKVIGIGREVSAKRKDDSVFPMDLAISEMSVSGTRMFVGIVRDITARKEVEGQLEDAKMKAEHANLAKSEFLATMSHEIRTPLNGILGMAELLARMELSEKEAKYVKTIMSSGELLLVLINDVLDFSKIEAGELELEKIPLVINALFSEVTQLLCSRASENNVEIAVNCPQDIPLAVLSDPVRLRQILINLIGNAIKFTKEGHVLINVAKQYSEDKRVGLRFEVTDTGIGIPKDKITNIFEQFSQGDSSTTRRFGGTGLGLAISKRLVELMGGRIGVNSVEGKGSTFWFEVECEVSHDFTQTELDITRHLKGVNILIVDDYQINLEIYHDYLRNVGIDCDIISSAEEGLAKIRHMNSIGKPYDVVVIDFHMPNMNGTDMGRVIKNDIVQYGSPQLILFTALDKSESLQEINTSVFCMHLLKPIYPNILIDGILQALKLKDEINVNTNKIKNSNLIRKTKKEFRKFNVHALVVDDFPGNIEVAQEMLEKVGCTVSTATNGGEALSLLSEDHSKYDIIFMDCQMPVMDGYTTTKNIREKSWGKSIPIVALTANTTKDASQKCFDAGMDEYISKPMKISDISGVLYKYFNKNGPNADNNANII